MVKINIKEENKKKFLNDAFILTVSAFIVKVLGVIYKVPLSYILTDEGMGYFNTAYTIFSCFYIICTAGVPKAVSILTARYRAEGNCGRAYRIYEVARNTFAVVGIVSTILLAIGAKPLARLIGNSDSAVSVFSIAFSLIFISVAGAYKGYLNGLGKQLPIALAEVTEGFFKLAFGLAFAYIAYKSGASYKLISAYTISGITLASIASALILGISANFSKSTDKIGQKCDFCKPQSNMLKTILKISVPIAFTSLVISATNIIDLSLIMRRLSYAGYSETQSNTIYGNYTTLATPFLNFTVALISPITVASLPNLTTSFASKKMKKFQEHFDNMISLSIFLSVPLTFGFMFFSEEILMLIFPKEAAISAAPHLTLLSPSFTLAALLLSVNTALESTGKTTVPLVSMSFAALFKFFVTYYLVGNHSVGVGGAAIGTVVFYAVALMFSSVALLRHTSISTKMLGGFAVLSADALTASYIAKFSLNQLKSITDIHVLTTPAAAIIYAAVYIILAKLSSKIIASKSKNVEIAQKNENVLSKEPNLYTK